MSNNRMSEHQYPSNYPPGTHWATDAAWEILDTLKPGLLTLAERSLIAGMISGRLMKERAETKLRCISIAENGGFSEAPTEAEHAVSDRIATTIRLLIK